MAFAQDLDGPWWETGALNRETHRQLIQQRHAIAQRAGLGEAFMSCMWELMPAEVTGAERKWVRDIITKEPPGVEPHRLYVGNIAHVASRFRALTGSLLRNFTDARILTVDEIVGTVLAGDDIEATVLFIPDFATGTKLSDAVARAMLGVMRQRIISGQRMSFFALDDAAVSRAYGPAACDEMSAHFTTVTVQ